MFRNRLRNPWRWSWTGVVSGALREFQAFPGTTTFEGLTDKTTANFLVNQPLSDALALLAPLASPTFTGPVTIPSGAAIAGYLTTVAGDLAYQPIGNYAPSSGIAPSAITGTAVITTDPRLSDARTPTAHTHDDRYFTETEADARFPLLVGNNTLTGNQTIDGTIFLDGGSAGPAGLYSAGC
jgi:hypothetical protein